MTKTTSVLAGVALAIAGTVGAASADPEAAPAEVSGVVTAIDRPQGRVTVRDASGKEVQFEASDETMRNLAVGDRIAAKKRAETPER